MTSFFGELRRRNVVKVAVAYAIVGWVLIEVSSVLLPTFRAPEWVMRVFSFFIIAGFPVALILSWAYELTPEGIKLERNVAAGESITPVTGRKLDFAIIGALVLALGFVVYNYVLVDGDVAGVLPNSVAVIPFENMSVDPEEAFYASGIHEEILNQLVKLSALNVIARTSMQQYANTEKSIPEIARELNVETVMEGSVRYANGQIRITIQLNDGVTGAHLWSETYTRDFEDIFAIESDVAMNVANAVGVEFSLAEQESIEKIPTDSPEAYRFYLAALETGGIFDTELQLDLLSRAISADPDFALAYARRAEGYILTLPRVIGTQEDYAARRAEWESLALEDLGRAITLDPDLERAHSALGHIHMYNWRGAEARDAYEHAYQIGQNDVSILRGYAELEAFSGRPAQAARLIQRAVELDPISPTTRFFRGIFFQLEGNLVDAANAYREILEVNPLREGVRTHLALLEIILGNNAQAESELRLAEPIVYEQVAGPYLVLLGYGYSRLGLHEDAERLLNRFEELAAEQRESAANWVMFNLALGDEEEAFRWLERVAEKEPYEGYYNVQWIKANLYHDPVLDKPEFAALREQLGFTDL